MIAKETKYINLSSPHISGKELKYVERAFDYNQVSSTGENVFEFERVLQSYLKGNKEVTALSAGTAAIHLALIMVGVQRDDEVICQSFTFSASANPILYQGATPIFVDSEKDTWNMCPSQLEIAIKDRISKGRKPKAVIVVHLYGMPAKIDELCSIANKYDIALIEDAAEALGSSYKGEKCGTFGDYGILSFNGNKIITTSGGGALICNSHKEKDKSVFLATQARDNAPHYQHSEIGYNYRMSNIVAGIGRGQMEVLEDRVTARRAMHHFYKVLFINNKEVTLFEEPTKKFYSNHWLSAILLSSYEIREALRIHLEKANIESRPLWKPMHLQPVFANSPYYGTNISEHLFERGLCLPSGSNLTDEDRIRIQIAITFFLKLIKS